MSTNGLHFPSGTVMRVMLAATLFDVVREHTGVEPKLWRCPCGDLECYGGAVYARKSDADGSRSYIVLTVSASETWPCFMALDHELDLMAAHVTDDSIGTISAADLRLLAAYLTHGLRDAICASGRQPQES